MPGVSTGQEPRSSLDWTRTNNPARRAGDVGKHWHITEFAVQQRVWRLRPLTGKWRLRLIIRRNFVAPTGARRALTGRRAAAATPATPGVVDSTSSQLPAAR